MATSSSPMTVRGQLLALSPATVDRLLRPLRQPHGLSTTKPGRLLKHQIPIRTFAEWTDVKPGFLEGDLVAHCGGTTDGAFLYTFTLTDIATTWTECLALLHRSQHGVVHALEQARRLFPFPILGIDTDNGSEFINEELLAYCDVGQITFTRGRVGNKNDQAWVEQKNGSVVRQLVGYDRFEGQRAYRQLAELYRAVRLYVNFFQPSMKLRTKTRTGSRVRRVVRASPDAIPARVSQWRARRLDSASADCRVPSVGSGATPPPARDLARGTLATCAVPQSYWATSQRSAGGAI